MPKSKYEIAPDVCTYWTEELAYVLGYMLADGNINKSLTTATFTSIDKDLLEIVRNVLTYGCDPLFSPLITERKSNSTYPNAKQQFDLTK